MKRFAALLLSTSMLLSPNIARADLLGDLADFWEKSGGGVNVTGPSSYNGQRAGYATLGSVQVKTRNRTSSLANIQLPSLRAGCGGIDVFAGSFSFISEEELIHLMEAIMQNAAGFAFELALESMSPAVQETVAKLRDLVQQVNAMNINSCEAGQLLAGSLWPKVDSAQAHICTTIGSYTGWFADQVSSRHECRNFNKQQDVINSAPESMRDQIPVNINYAWQAIQKNNFLRSDRTLAEFFMTLTGTIITKAAESETEGPKQDPIPPRAISSEMVSVLVDGGTTKILRCNETTKCLSPELTDVTIPRNDALVEKAAAAIRSIYVALKTDDGTPPSADAKSLINMTSVPVYQLLVTSMAYKYVFAEAEIDAIAEIVAVDLAMIYIDQAITEMSRSAGRVSTFGEITIEFQNQLKDTQKAFAARYQIAQNRYQDALKTLERLKTAQQELSGSTASQFAKNF
jgi:conjugative transfer pilus assembly protein TraH